MQAAMKPSSWGTTLQRVPATRKVGGGVLLLDPNSDGRVTIIDGRWGALLLLPITLTPMAGGVFYYSY